MSPSGKSPKKTPAKRGASSTRKPASLTAEEREAMKERVRELKKAGAKDYDGEREVMEKIAEMPEPDRSMATRVHAVVKAAAPELVPRTWYGMPAYAKDGNVLCFFQGAYRFKARYATFGFSDKAHLDEGNMWAAGFAIQKLTKVEEKRIAELVRKAVG